MIPEDKQAAVKNALQTAFGVDAFEQIELLTAGLSSALIYRIVVRGRPYLLRVITRGDAMGDPSAYYGCMQSAAEAGIAPRVRYAGVADRISITDYVEPRPFPASQARQILPGVLRRLHALPPFPAPRFTRDYIAAAQQYAQRFQAARLLPEERTAAIFGAFERIAAVYPRQDGEWVSCHNDLKPENILFDGRRAWLIDWEAAFWNDRNADLCVVANFVARDEREEDEFLRNYYGEEPGDYRRARFFLMRQVSHIFYFTLLMLIASGGKPLDPHPAVPAFRDFHDRMWAGEISLKTDEARLQYAWVHLEQAARSLQSARFSEALRIVEDGSKGEAQ